MDLVKKFTVSVICKHYNYYLYEHYEHIFTSRYVKAHSCTYHLLMYSDINKSVNSSQK